MGLFPDWRKQVTVCTPDGPASPSNPIDVRLTDPVPIVVASALEITNDEGTPIPVQSAALDALVLAAPVNANGVPYVTTARAKFRDAFLTFDTTDNWTLVQTGAGMTLSVAGVLNGARYLNIASGTTINAETILISKTRFKAPTSVIVGFSMSQRIANCDAFLEVVEVDANGDVITDATIASAVVKNARNAASLRFTGTTATSQTLNVRQDGLSEVSAVGTFVTTAATGTGPNFIPAGLFEIALRTRDLQVSSVAIDTNAAKTFPLARTMRVPNPDGLYALRIRVLNGASAPATSTDVRIHSVVVLDDTRMSVDFGGIAGVANLSNAAPVQVTNPLTLAANTPTLAAGTAAVGYVGAQAPLLVTDVASAAITTTTTTAWFTPTAGSSYEVNLPVTAVGGTNPTLDVTIEESDDSGTNGFQVYAFPRITGTGMYRSGRLPLIGNRIRFVQTLGGTSPSFTRAVNRLQRHDSVPRLCSLIDRAINPNSLGSASAWLYVEGCKTLTLTVVSGAGATTSPVYAIVTSDDQVSVFLPANITGSLGSVTVGASQAQTASVPVNAKWARIQIITAGVAATHTRAELRGGG